MTTMQMNTSVDKENIAVNEKVSTLSACRPHPRVRSSVYLCNIYNIYICGV